MEACPVLRAVPRPVRPEVCWHGLARDGTLAGPSRVEVAAAGAATLLTPPPHSRRGFGYTTVRTRLGDEARNTITGCRARPARGHELILLLLLLL